MHWQEIDGWFRWRSAQEEAVRSFPESSRFVEVGAYLGRSLCSLGEVAQLSGRKYTIIGVDTCRASGPEGPKHKDYHGVAVAQGGGTFVGALHRNVLECGYGDAIALVIADSVDASGIFADRSIDWLHLDGRHDYEGLSCDINAWLCKVKIGGWISGDDYDEAKWPDVVRAVTDLLPQAEPWSTGQWRWIVTQ